MKVPYSNPVLLTAFFSELPQLVYDEGIVLSTYPDSLGLPTMGIGSLLKPGMPEFEYEIGTPVSEERVLQAFIDEFVFDTFSDVKSVYPNYQEMPQEAVQIVLNLLYQLGRGRYLGFKKHVAAMRRADWNTAAHELRDSKLYRQAKKRTERRARRLEKI